MESHEIMREVMQPMGVKAIASEMQLSSSLLYKWCQPREGEDAAGAANPLDRIEKLCTVTNDYRVVEWLCAMAGGYFARNPETDHRAAKPLLKTTQGILKDFTHLLDVVSRSIENDGVISDDESEQIRSAWDRLKTCTESFVVACEEGHYI